MKKRTGKKGAGPKGVSVVDPNGQSAMMFDLSVGVWDDEEERDSLAVSLSEDRGATWRWSRHLENTKGGRFGYPSVVQSKDGSIHATYSFNLHTVRHALFNGACISILALGEVACTATGEGYDQSLPTLTINYLYSRVLYGTRVSLAIGVSVAMVVAPSVGGVVGSEVSTVLLGCWLVGEVRQLIRCD